MKLVGKKKVKVSSLTTDVFVRQALDQERVWFFGNLIQDGVEIPPIKVDKNNRVNDGRHRLEAYITYFPKIEEIEVQVWEFESEVEFISEAFKSNLRGALPPNKKDMLHTVGLLFDKGVPQKQISDLVGLPLSTCKDLIARFKRKEKEVRLKKALRAVADSDMTAQVAADIFKLNKDELMRHISGKKGNDKVSLDDFGQRLINQNRSHGQKTGKLMRMVFERFDEGDISATQAFSIVDAALRSLKSTETSIRGWRNRIKAKNGGVG